VAPQTSQTSFEPSTEVSAADGKVSDSEESCSADDIESCASESN